MREKILKKVSKKIAFSYPKVVFLNHQTVIKTVLF